MTLVHSSSATALNISELVDLICAFTHDPDALHDLLSLSLVCRRFTSPAQTQLFHTLDLVTPLIKISFPKLLQTLSSHPHFLPHIRSIHASLLSASERKIGVIGDRKPLAGNILDFLRTTPLPGLTHLELSNGAHIGMRALDGGIILDVRNLLATLPITHLTLKTALAHPVDLDVLFGQCTPTLRTLTLGVNMLQDLCDGAPFKPADCVIQNPSRRPQLQTLTLHDTTFRNPLENWLSQPPSRCPLDLRTLRTAKIMTAFNAEPKEFLDKGSFTLEDLEISATDLLNGPTIANLTRLRRLVLTQGHLPQFIDILSALPHQLNHLETLALYWSDSAPDSAQLRMIDNIVADLSALRLTSFIVPIPWESELFVGGEEIFDFGIRTQLDGEEWKRIADVFPRMSMRGVLRVQCGDCFSGYDFD
ncbi:hypothetical protein R3P38DRAFT_3234038 [Favolaschia claudopus]|uniref:F-box domain-containing protein n=1 Tax=Favolaschia claudopus TaxID=2862362 RepID=A0AAV9ZI62_9AGAR